MWRSGKRGEWLKLSSREQECGCLGEQRNRQAAHLLDGPTHVDKRDFRDTNPHHCAFFSSYVHRHKEMLPTKRGTRMLKIQAKK